MQGSEEPRERNLSRPSPTVQKSKRGRDGYTRLHEFLDLSSAYFHITIRKSLQSCSISMSAREAGAAALTDESEKDDKHQEAVERTGCMFFPLKPVHYIC